MVYTAEQYAIVDSEWGRIPFRSSFPEAKYQFLHIRQKKGAVIERIEET